MYSSLHFACWVLPVALLCAAGGVGGKHSQQALIGHLASQQQWVEGRSLADDRRPWVEPVSWEPRAFVYHNFLSEEECDHFIQIARPYMRRSTVVADLEKSNSYYHDIRTSYGMFIHRLADTKISAIEERVSHWTKLPISHQEATQVLRYEKTQRYGSHYDSSMEEQNPRIATVIMYLSDVEEGGETAFTLGSKWIDPSLPEKLGPFSPCAEGHVAMKPKRGDALIFWGLKPDGTDDKATFHAACPVIEGVKWVAIKWIHVHPFRPENLGKAQPMAAKPRPEDCVDTTDACADWARRGECTKNALFMRGDNINLGQCRAACGDCEVCGPADRECQNRNRVRAGYLPLSDEPHAL